MSDNNDVYAICSCASYDFMELQQYLLENMRCTAYRNVLNVQWKQGDAFIFSYGVVVFWQIDAADRLSLLEKLSPYEQKSLLEKIDDEFTLIVNSEKPGIKNDQILLPDADVMNRLAVSHGIAQSIKLGQFEIQVQQTINDTAYIPQSIAETGKTHLRRNDLSKLRGRLFITKSDIMLNYDLLDIPDFFWEYPELDHFYNMVSDYLEIRQRVDVLSKKLETIHELFEMMAEELKHKHSSLLEWIIIWLIAFEILVFLVHDIFNIL